MSALLNQSHENLLDFNEEKRRVSYKEELELHKKFISSNSVVQNLWEEFLKQQDKCVDKVIIPKHAINGDIKQTPNNNSTDRWVNPIREKSDIKKCIDYLHEKALSATRLDTQRAAYRDWFLFVVGINVGLRVSDLTQLKWDNIFESDMKTFVDGRNKEEQKTGKMKLICPNDYMKKVVKEYLYFSDVEPKADEYVFLSGRKNRNGEYSPISDAAVEKMIKEVTGACGIVGTYNTHSLRKSYAYHKYMMYVKNNDPLALVKVQKDLNHRNSSDTARYLGITRDEQIKSSMELGEYWDM